MKIICYLPALHAPGGMERIITFKANYLAEHFDEYEVVLLTSEQVGLAPHFKLSPKVKHIDLDVPFDWPSGQTIIGKAMRYPGQYRLFKERFSHALCDLKADITISTLRRELNFIHSIPDGSVKIGEFHSTREAYGIGSQENANFLAAMMHQRWERGFLHGLKRFKKVVFLTPCEAALWPELENTSVIPNPITTPPVTQPSDCTRKQVIAAGRFDYAKGFDRLIRSWAIVTQRFPDWTLRIYGEGAMRQAYEEMIQKLGIGNTCILEHTVNNITEKYCESSILAVPSRNEGFGMVITEAMACGVPTVAFDCPCGPRYIINDGQNGLLVENGNIAKFAESLCYLIECDKVRTRMGQQALLSSERFTPNHIIKKWDELFKQLTIP